MGSGNSNFFADIGDIALRAATGNMASFDQDDGFHFQTSEDLILKLIKEGTGATAAEEAIKSQERMFAKEQEDIEKDRNERKAQFAKEQIQSSKLASAARNTNQGKASSASKSGSGSSKPSQQKLGGGEQDFLGL